MSSALGWRPADFWSASLVELFLSIEGHNEMNGGNNGRSGFSDEDRAEVERLKAKYGC